MRELLGKMLSLVNSTQGVRLIGQAMASCANLLRAILVTLVFGTAVFGVYSFYVLVCTILINILIAVFVEPATSISASIDGDGRRRYISTLLYIFAALIAFICIPNFYITSVLTHTFLKKTEVNTYAASVFMLLFISAGITRAFIQAFSEKLPVILFDALQSSLTLSLLIFVLAQSSEFSNTEASDLVLWSQVLGLGTSLLIFVFYAVKNWGLAQLDMQYLSLHARRSLLVSQAATLRALQLSLPALWAQTLLGEKIFGTLRLYQTLANFISFPTMALRLVNMSTGANALKTGGSGALVAYVFQISRRLSFLAGSMGLILLISMLLLPSHLRPSPEGLCYLILFLLVNIFAVTNSTLSSFFYASGHLSPLVTRSLVAVLVALILAPCMITFFGGIGAPLSQVAVSLLSIAINLVAIGQSTRILRRDIKSSARRIS